MIYWKSGLKIPDKKETWECLFPGGVLSCRGNVVFGKKKGGLWSLLTGGLYWDGKYKSNFCWGDFERSLLAGGPCSEVVSRSGLTVYSNGEFRQTWRRSNGNDFSYECATYQPNYFLPSLFPYIHPVGRLYCANHVLNAKKQFLAAVKKRVMSAIFVLSLRAQTRLWPVNWRSWRHRRLRILILTLTINEKQC